MDVLTDHVSHDVASDRNDESFTSYERKRSLRHNKRLLGDGDGDSTVCTRLAAYHIMTPLQTTEKFLAEHSKHFTNLSLN
jgi:hypothetical protein